MASTVPAKSQPLHNFGLPHLWKKNHAANNHQRGRSRLAESSSPPPPPLPSLPNQSSSPSRRQHSPSYISRRHQSPLLDPARMTRSPLRDSESESEHLHYHAAVSSAQKHRNLAGGVSISSSSNHPVVKSDKRSSDLSRGTKSSKISIRFGKNRIEDAIVHENHEKAPQIEGDEEESMPKTWNLRPRRPSNKQSNGVSGAGNNGNGGVQKIVASSSSIHHEKNNNNNNNHKSHNHGAENKESESNSSGKKQKFSISLTREEIEEDIFALTGSKPSRRPKKRPRTVQKQIDTLFPGLWLGCITPDSYKVSEAPTKG